MNRLNKCEVQIVLFGQLTDIAGNNTIAVNDVPDTDALIKAINQLYPAMSDVKYVIAVDKKIIRLNVILTENSEVALLPAFSGG